jgi:hypothetical protein
MLGAGLFGEERIRGDGLCVNQKDEGSVLL